MYGLTPRQSEVLEYLKSRPGNIGPSYEEIKEACGFASKAGVYAVINALKERGNIETPIKKEINMSLPSLEQYQSGLTTWKREYKGVSYTLSHHGISDYSPQGTWCFYIFINSNMFVNHADFNLFNREPEIKEISPGSFWETYDYWNVPDYGFHGGITWYSKEGFVDRDGKQQTSIKIGCDYAHLYDMECNYYHGLDDVNRDVELLIEKLIEINPVKMRCKYSGKLDVPEQFYTAKNGAIVHFSQIEKLKEVDGWWEHWQPKDNAE